MTPMDMDDLAVAMGHILAVILIIIVAAVAYANGFERGSSTRLRSSCDIEKPSALKAGWYRS